MNKPLKIFVCLMLSFAFCILSVGYASTTTQLSILGAAYNNVPTGIFIQNVEVIDGEGGLDHYFSTTMKTYVALGDSADSTVTLRVTFYNNSNERYDYAGVTYVDEAYSNSNIIFHVHNFSCGTLYVVPQIEENAYLTCDVTFSYGSFTPDNNTLTSLLNFNFGPATNEKISVTEGVNSNNLATLNDGKVNFNSSDTSLRWTNWSSDNSLRGSASTLCILDNGNEITFDSLTFHFFIDTGGCHTPEAVEVYIYDDELGDYVLLFADDDYSTLEYSNTDFTKTSNYTRITRSNGNTGIATVYFDGSRYGSTIDYRYTGAMPATTYKLTETITTRGIKIVIDAEPSWFIGLVELEIHEGNDNIIR